MMKKGCLIFLLFILLGTFGNVNAEILNVHADPLYPNLSYTPIRVYADVFGVGGISQATLYYRINDVIYSNYFSISKGVSSFIYEDISDNVQVFYWIEAINNSGEKELTAEYNFTYDGTPPIINIAGDNPLAIGVDSIYEELGATASDSVYGDLTSSIAISGTVDTNTIGEYIVNYTVSDLAGNTATATRTVNVVEAVPGSGAPASSGGGGGFYSASGSGDNPAIVIENSENASTAEIVNPAETPPANKETKKGFFGFVGSAIVGPISGIKIVVAFAIVLVLIAAGIIFVRARIKRKLWGK